MDGDTGVDPRAVTFLTAVAAQAERGADRVAAFLRELGLAPDGENEVSLPAETLLGLDLALKFAAWEGNGIWIHVEAGLPDAESFLKQVLGLFHGPALQTLVTQVGNKALLLFAHHFCWGTFLEQRVELAMSEVNDELLLEAMADFLWGQSTSS